MARETRTTDTDFLRRMGIVVDDGAPMLEDSERVQELEAKVIALTHELRSVREVRDSYRSQGMQYQKENDELRRTIEGKIRQAIEMYKATVMKDGAVAPNVSPVPDVSPKTPSIHDLINVRTVGARSRTWNTGVSDRWDTGREPTYTREDHSDIDEELGYDDDGDDDHSLGNPPCPDCDDYSAFQRHPGKSDIPACINCRFN